MYDYSVFADYIGMSVKAAYSPFFTESKHREAFDQLVDAKVKLNKQMFDGLKTYANELEKVYSKILQS